MPLTDYKVTSYGGKDVASAPDALKGTIPQNKAVFDNLTKGLIVPNFNNLIDALVSTAGANSGAAQIGVTVSGVAGNTVYAVLAALQTSKADATATANALNTKADKVETYTKTQVDTMASGKVDKVAGKHLSANDYTTAEKDKLAGIAANANNYSLPIASAAVLGGIKVGAGLEVQSDGTVNGVSAPAPDLVARQRIADHEANGTIHVDSAKKAGWDSKAPGVHTHTPDQAGAAPSSHTHNISQINDGNNLYNLLNSIAISLASELNLDNYRTPGIFSCNASNVYNAMTNLPEVTFFKLIVEKSLAANSEYYRQTFMPYNKPYCYARSYLGSAWTPWGISEKTFVQSTTPASPTVNSLWVW